MQTLRTGARSVWFELAKNTPTHFPSLQGSGGKFDVAVIGGGITGLSTAACLLSSGIKKIAVVEALQIGKGVTGYSTCKVTSQHNIIYSDLASRFGEKTAEVYASLNQYGVQQVANTISKYNIECDSSRQSAYIYTQEERYVEQLKKESQAAAKTGHISSEFTTKTTLPFSVLGAVRFDDQLQFNSYDYCVGLSKQLAQEGVQIFEETRITEVEHLNSPHLLKTEGGASLEADHVVLATHLPFLDRSGHFACVEPICSYVVAYKAPNNQEKYFQDGMYISIEEPTRSIRMAGNGSVLIVGGVGHKLGDPPGGDTQNAIQDIEKWTKEHYGDLEKICHWMAHDYRPPDHLPYIGYLHRGCHTIYCATGFMKWGLSLGSAAGKIISDLIVNQGELKGTESGGWHEVVDARRWDLLHSAPQIVKAQAHVTKHLVGDKVKEVVCSLDIEDLVPGKGGLCKNNNGEHVAAYRDETGNLYQVSPVCRHLGCTVLWNQSDKTWDCPCHGSRYNFDGTVIHGPAVSDLKKIQQA